MKPTRLLVTLFIGVTLAFAGGCARWNDWEGDDEEYGVSPGFEEETLGVETEDEIGDDEVLEEEEDGIFPNGW